MTRKRFFVLISLPLLLLCCAAGVAAWIFSAPASPSFAPKFTQNDGKTHVYLGKTVEADFCAEGINIADLAAGMTFFDKDANDITASVPNEVKNALASGVFQTPDGAVALSDEKQMVAGGTYSLAVPTAALPLDYAVDGVYDGGFKEQDVPLNLLFKYKTVSANGADAPWYTVEDGLNSGLQTLVLAKGKTAFSALPDDFTGYTGASYRTLGAGRTFVVPCKTGDLGNIRDYVSAKAETLSHEQYSCLLVPPRESGASFIVDGGIFTVNAVKNSADAPTGIIGNYGQMQVQKGALAEIKSGVFNCMGYAFGEGEIKVFAAAMVKEVFSMPGFKGSSVTGKIKNTVFPINQYALCGIICKTHIESGAHYIAQAFLTATFLPIQPEVSVMSAEEGSFFRLKSGKLTKYTDERDGKIRLDFAGEMDFGNMSINLSTAATSAGKQMPLPGNFEINLQAAEGAQYRVPPDVTLKLLPGAKLAVQKGACLAVEGGLLAYCQNNFALDGVSAWQDGGKGMGYGANNAFLKKCYRELSGEICFDENTPAVVEVAGTVTVQSGAAIGVFFTGAQGAEIFIEGGTLKGNVIKEDMTAAAEQYFSAEFFTLGDTEGGGKEFSYGSFRHDGRAWQKT